MEVLTIDEINAEIARFEAEEAEELIEPDTAEGETLRLALDETLTPSTRVTLWCGLCELSGAKAELLGLDRC